MDLHLASYQLPFSPRQLEPLELYVRLLDLLMRMLLLVVGSRLLDVDLRRMKRLKKMVLERGSFPLVGASAGVGFAFLCFALHRACLLMSLSKHISYLRVLRLRLLSRGLSYES